MIQLNLHVAVLNLRVRKSLRHVVDRSAWNAYCAQCAQPVLGAALLGKARHFGDERIAVAHAVGVAQKTHILRQPSLASGRTKFTELGVVAHRDDDVAIGRRKCLVGHDIGVRVTVPARHHTRNKMVLALVREHGDLAVEQRHVDVLATALTVSPHQCRQDGHSGIHAGHEVRHRHTDFLGAAAWHVVGVAGDAHQAARALNHEVITRLRFKRTVLAKAGDRAIDQVRVDRLQIRVGQTVALQITGFEIFNQHVTLGDECAHDALALFGSDVQRDGLFAAVGTQKISGFKGVCAVAILQEWRAPCTGVVAAGGAFDLQDFSAEVREVLAGPGTSQHARQVQHTQMGKGSGHKSVFG